MKSFWPEKILGQKRLFWVIKDFGSILLSEKKNLAQKENWVQNKYLKHRRDTLKTPIDSHWIPLTLFDTL